MDEQQHRRRRVPQENAEAPQENIATHIVNASISKEECPIQHIPQKNATNNKKYKKRRNSPFLIAATIIEGFVIAILVLSIAMFIFNGWTENGIIGFANGIIATPTHTPLPTPTPTPQVEYVYITPQPTFTPTPTPIPTAIPTPIIEYVYITPQPTFTPTPTPIPTAVPTPIIEYVYITPEPTATPPQWGDNVIYNDECISVIYSEIWVDDVFLNIELMFENKTDTVIEFNCDTMIVNGFALEDTLEFIDLPANTKYLYTIESLNDQYIKLGITEIETVGMLLNYKIDDEYKYTNDIQSPIIILAENDSNNNFDSDIDIDSIVATICSYKNGETDKAFEMIEKYHSYMSKPQLQQCLVSCGRWMSVEEAENELLNHLRSPRSYYRNSGSVGQPQLQPDGTYKVVIELDYNAANGFGGEVRSDVEMYVYFKVNLSERTVSFTKAEPSPLFYFSN